MAWNCAKIKEKILRRLKKQLLKSANSTLSDFAPK